MKSKKTERNMFLRTDIFNGVQRTGLAAVLAIYIGQPTTLAQLKNY
jgi:hypothetical protein